MADVKSAYRLVDEIPKHDPVKALQELTSWIESVSAESDFPVDYQLSLLRLLDQAARSYETRLKQEYFAVMAPQKIMESRLWKSLNEYCVQVSLSCLMILWRFSKDDKGSAAIRMDLPLIAVRGIDALADRLKYAVARYAPVEPAVWEQLSELYATAESLGYVDAAVPKYEGPDGNTSVRREFAAVMVWYASCAGSVGRVDIHLARRLTIHLRASFTVDENCGPNSLFDFDLQHPAPPVRITSDASPRPGRLCIAVEGVQESIAACLKALEKNFVPTEFNLGGNYDADLVRNVLQRLAASWTLPKQARRNVRLRASVNIKVVNGFSAVVEQIGRSGDTSPAGCAVWEADDISNGGFSALLAPQDARGLEVGSLIGAQPENVKHWGAGIVRRLSRNKQLSLHVGVELLSSRVQSIMLHGLNVEAGDAGQPALWFDGDNLGEVKLLLKRHAFAAGRSWHARLDGKLYLLTPIVLLERAKDTDFARFRMEAEQAD